MSRKTKALPERVEGQAHKLRPFLDAFERLDAVLPENGREQFKLPYTTRPNVPSREWKLKLDA